MAPPETVTLRPDTVCVTSSPSNRATADPPRTLMTPVVPPVSVKVMVRSGVPSPTATSTGPTANITRGSTASTTQSFFKFRMTPFAEPQDHNNVSRNA